MIDRRDPAGRDCCDSVAITGAISRAGGDITSQSRALIETAASECKPAGTGSLATHRARKSATLLDSPRSWKPRKWLFWMHLYSGLILGLLLMVAGISGAALVYSPELEVAPGWADARAHNPLPPGRLLEIAGSRFPGFRLQDIRFNSHGDATILH